MGAGASLLHTAWGPQGSGEAGAEADVRPCIMVVWSGEPCCDGHLGAWQGKTVRAWMLRLRKVCQAGLPFLLKY